MGIFKERQGGQLPPPPRFIDTPLYATKAQFIFNKFGKKTQLFSKMLWYKFAYLGQWVIGSMWAVEKWESNKKHKADDLQQRRACIRSEWNFYEVIVTEP